jgi:metal-dependent amidase/aminoacylase/carboxypeptidase family protein
LARQLKRISRGIAAACGVKVDVSWNLITPATNNDPALTEFAAAAARDLGLTVVPATPGMGGEDFALYQRKIPGVFWTIGVGSPQGAHHPGFIANPAPLGAAAELLAALAVTGLRRLSGFLQVIYDEPARN